MSTSHEHPRRFTQACYRLGALVRGGALPAWVMPVCLALLVLACHYPALFGGFVGMDDALMMEEPFRDAQPWWQDLWDIAAGRHSTRAYYPVFHLSLALDRWLWQQSPLASHLENVLLHALNAVLVFWLLQRLHTALQVPAALRVASAGLAAALFAVHPVNVEPVAWASGRKMLLALCFVLLCVHAHVQSDGPRRWRWRLLSLLCFAAGCLSNASVTSVPLLLLACDHYTGRKPFLRSCLSNGAFFAIAGLMALHRWRFTVEPAVGKSVDPTHLLVHRLEGIWQESLSLVWPVNLSCLYEETPAGRVWLPAALGGLVLVAFVALSVARRCPRFPAFLAAWYWIGLLPTFAHHFARADRHLYLPAIGVFGLLGLAVARSAEALRGGRGARCASVLLVATTIVCLGNATRRQSGYWHDSLTLFGRAVALGPDCWLARGFLADALTKTGAYDQAEVHFKRAVSLLPDDALSYFGLGHLASQRGRHAEAIDYYRQALSIDPAMYQVHNSWGVALGQLGRHEEATAHYRSALELHADYAECHSNLASSLAALGDGRGALRELNRAVELAPDSAAIHANLADLLVAQGETNQAATHYQEALRLDPALRGAHVGLANLLVAAGQLQRAANLCRQALTVDPHDVAAMTTLAHLEKRLGRPEEAVWRLRTALDLSPDDDHLWEILGTTLEELGDVEAIVNHYRRFTQRQAGNAFAVRGLAAGLLAKGQYSGAIESLQSGLTHSPGDPELTRLLSWALSTCPAPSLRDGPKALELIKGVAESQDASVELLDTLAAAYAACGRFTQAAQSAQHALDLARYQQRQDAAHAISGRLALYRSGKPYVASPPTGH